jgi:hypothetical protein
MNFKKLYKTRRKTLNFIHKDTVSLVLMLIIVVHHFLYESTTYINTKIKQNTDRKILMFHGIFTNTFLIGQRNFKAKYAK